MSDRRSSATSWAVDKNARLKPLAGSCDFVFGLHLFSGFRAGGVVIACIRNGRKSSRFQRLATGLGSWFCGSRHSRRCMDALARNFAARYVLPRNFQTSTLGSVPKETAGKALSVLRSLLQKLSRRQGLIPAARRPSGANHYSAILRTLLNTLVTLLMRFLQRRVSKGLSGPGATPACVVFLRSHIRPISNRR